MLVMLVEQATRQQQKADSEGSVCVKDGGMSSFTRRLPNLSGYRLKLALPQRSKQFQGFIMHQQQGSALRRLQCFESDNSKSF